MKNLRLTIPLAIAAAGIGAPAALAQPGAAGLAGTFPHAARLCARASAGDLPARVAADAAPISAACTTLQTSYGSAVQTYTTAVAPIPGEVQAVFATLRAARLTARQTGDASGLATARTQARTTLQTLRGEVRTDRVNYHTAIAGARVTFWSTVTALPGAHGLPTDSGTTASPSTPVVPTSAG